MIEYKEENKAYFTISVTDLHKAKEFYKDIFGFEVLWDYKIGGFSKEVGWAELALPFHAKILKSSIQCIFVTV